MIQPGPLFTPEFQLKPYHEQAFLSDGFKICELALRRGQIRSHRDLQSILLGAAQEDIVLIPRSMISPFFLQEIANDAFDGHIPAGNDWAGRWNEVGSSNPKNAMPHTHEVRNCHAAPDATDCNTAFFDKETTIAVARDLSTHRKYDIHIRISICRALQLLEQTGDQSNFFDALHNLEPPASGSQLSLLQFVADLQQGVCDQSTVFRVNFAQEGYGIVGIPANCLHGRFVLDDLVRQERTAWRYFPDSVSR